ncbi:RNA polymerase sigma factor [Nocardia thraciensis]
MSFDELLLEVMASTHDRLLAAVTKRVGNRTDAEDIVQTALLRVYRTKPDIAEADKLRSYLWVAAMNLVRDSWRRAADARRRDDPCGDERLALLAEHPGPTIDDVVALRHTVLAALGTLPPREREALISRTFRDNTYAETARIMGVSTGTVKGYVHDALARVRVRLEAV